MNNHYIPVIGLEIHVELKTKSKMFCQCPADYFGKPPNSNTCPVCLGMPGALPVANRTAVEWTIKIAKALNCRINSISKFDRKHYFYPDLPKGYQISQYDEPIAVQGRLDIIHPKSGKPKSFRIHRVHLEEDTGKLMHEGTDTLIDFNRSSVPLVEIVTEPDFNNAEDVKMFLEELHTIIRYLDVSDADMEKGTMRLEPNISVRKVSDTGLPPYKVEVKNINSFNYVKRAIEYELVRHTEILKSGKLPKQETRGYNEKKNTTYPQRSKEDAQDYRYFPEPDIPPMKFDTKMIKKIVSELPELPSQKTVRYHNDYGIRLEDAFFLTRQRQTAMYFERVYEYFMSSEKSAEIQNPAQTLANLIINKKLSIDLSIEEFVQKAHEQIAPKQTDMSKLQGVIERVLQANPKAVSDYKSGKRTVIMFLLGQTMRELRGQADAQVVKSELEKVLG